MTGRARLSGRGRERGVEEDLPPEPLELLVFQQVRQACRRWDRLRCRRPPLASERGEESNAENFREQMTGDVPVHAFLL
jgi:hypothetical protein